VSDDAGRTSSPPVRTDLAAVVLAAGLGTRLRPLTALRPKALCPVNKVPLVDLALQRVADQVLGSPGAGSPPDPRQYLAVNAHHHAELVERHLAGRAHVSVERPAPLGTAGALGRLRPWLDGRGVLVTNADAYLPAPFDDLVTGWDGDRCRLLVRDLPGSEHGDFERAGRPVRYVGACLLPWRLVAGLTEEPSGLYEVLWRREDEAGRLDLVVTGATAIDCGTPADYLAANLHASGGTSVVGDGAVVEGTLDRSVVWDGAFVGPDEHLVRAVRAGTRTSPLTVDCR
jgi:CTP:molybdopterin cytidylyltransferase MocA